MALTAFSQGRMELLTLKLKQGAACGVLIAFGAGLVASPALAGPRWTPKKRVSATKNASAASKALIKAGIAKARPSGFISLKVQGGAVAVLSGFASRFRANPSGVGVLMPMGQVVSRQMEEIKSGKVLPGDPVALEFQRWLDERKRNPKRASARAPGELNDDQVKAFYAQYGRALVPDLKAYALFIHDTVLVEEGVNEPRQAADLMFQYACRALSRLLPGFAKIVEVRIASGPDTTGDWDAPYDLDRSPEPKRRGGVAAASKPSNPPPREEVVEVCSITHRQVEETVRRDLYLLASSIDPKKGQRRDITPISGVPRLAGQQAPADADAVPLDKYDPQFKDLTFQHVTKRLLAFHRKKGSARNFARAVGASKNVAQRFAATVNQRTPDAAKAESRFHSNPKTIDARARRETLRRAVEQWTYGYEYESVAQLVIKRLPRLSAAYTPVEEAINDEFWSDCKEISAICEAPSEPLELRACGRCAAAAFRTYCLEGKTEDGKCRPIKEAEAPAAPMEGGPAQIAFAVARKVMSQGAAATAGFVDNPPTNLRDWIGRQLVVEAFWVAAWAPKDVAKDVAAGSFYRRLGAWIVSKKFFAKEEKQAEGYTRAGMRYLDSLPLTSWQRCWLWNPRQDKEKSCLSGELSELSASDVSKLPWEDAVIFSDAVKARGRKVRTHLEAMRAKAGSFGSKEDLEKLMPFPSDDANPQELTGQQSDAVGKSADAAAEVAGPVVGKLLGMLLQAAGLNDTMKVLAQAAGMTPQQSADCEDMEYRQTVMKLSGNDDNKRTCLTRIFAKNFTNVLENIIVMLGNKLVDWGVDLIRTLLQAVKSSLLAAAGSVPFAGGFLATVVDIVWEMVMNYGAKALLKGFVVAKLPDWLKVKELASQPFEQVMTHPIVQVVLGIILMLIDAAMVHGEKSWMEVGVDTVLSSIQKFLENPPGGKQPEWFWLRALTFAKRRLREQTGIASGGSGSMSRQVESVAKAMIEGFLVALQRRLDGESQALVEKAKTELLSLDFAKIAKRLVSNPTDILKVLREQVAPKIGGLLLPIVAAFAPMPPWARSLLTQAGSLFSELIAKKGRVTGLWTRLVEALAPLGQALVEQVPIADTTLKGFLSSGYRSLVAVLRNPSVTFAKLPRPGEALGAFVALIKPVLVERANALVTDPGLASDRAGFAAALGQIASAFDRGRFDASLAEAAGRVRKVIAALVGPLDSAATSAFAFVPLQQLISRGARLLGELLADPAKLGRDLASAKSFTITVLAKLADLFGGFASDAATALLPAGLGRNLALLAIHGVKAVLGDPRKLAPAMIEAQHKPMKLVRSLLGGSTGFLSVLLVEVKSDALRSLLQMGVDLAMSQLVSEPGPPRPGFFR